MPSRRRKKQRRTKSGNESIVKDLKQNTPSDERDTAAVEESVSVETTELNSDATADESSVVAETSHLERVAETLSKVERLLAEANQPSKHALLETSDWQQLLDESLEKTQRKITGRFKQFTTSIEVQLQELREAVSSQLGTLTESPTSIIAAVASSETDTKAEESADSSNAWERCKSQMYADLDETAPGDEDGDLNAASAKRNTEQDELDSLQESLHDSIESLDGVEAEEIEELRAQLTEKLREAEVELSINRAKLDQRKAELERRQTELDRREKSLESKYANVNGAPQKMGVLDRLTRHLGVRKQTDAL